MTTSLRTLQARTVLTDEPAAIAALRAQLNPDTASVVLLYCSPSYDLERLGAEIEGAFSCPVLACTSDGQIGEAGYVNGGITAVSLTSKQLKVTPYFIATLTDSSATTDVGYRVVAQLIRRASPKAFGLLLIDGLSLAEERTTSALFEVLGGMPLVGGSAADERGDAGAFVYHQGAFHSNAAVLALFETSLPFATFKVQHVEPGLRKVVITEADAARRVVHEINGKPAAAEYARLLGIGLDELDPAVCAEHPLLWSFGGEHFVRGIRAINTDGSLSFFCAIEAGLVLSIGEPSSPLAALRAGFQSAQARVATPQVVLGFDCLARRHEFERRDELDSVGAFLASQNVVGFSTSGEQFDAVHVNQTFTAVAIGAE